MGLPVPRPSHPSRWDFENEATVTSAPPLANGRRPDESNPKSTSTSSTSTHNQHQAAHHFLSLPPASLLLSLLSIQSQSHAPRAQPFICLPIVCLVTVSLLGWPQLVRVAILFIIFHLSQLLPGSGLKEPGQSSLKCFIHFIHCTTDCLYIAFFDFVPPWLLVKSSNRQTHSSTARLPFHP